jgi:hypothetical protein
MLRIIAVGFICLFWLAGCNPALTKMINHVSKKNRGDSIFIVEPIIESRIQYNKNSYWEDSYDGLQLARTLTKTALHELFDDRLPVQYVQPNYNDSWRANELDSILAKFLNTKYERFLINKKLLTPTSSGFILVPYLIWTRTTPEFESEKCGLDGKTYMLNRVCTWTQAQAFLFLVDKKNGEIVYYKDSFWSKEGITEPFQHRVTKSFMRASQPLLRSLGKR